MRRILYALALVLILCACAYADAALYKGSGNIGSVRTTENNGVLCVPVEDAGKLLGFTSSRSGGELSLSRGKNSLRLIAGASAAWRGMSIVPLYSAPFERDGKLWLDTQSAAALFQSVLGAGSANRLRFSGTGVYTASAVVSKNDSEFGNFDTPKAEIDIASIMSRTSRKNPAPQTQQTQTTVPAIVIPQSQPAPAIMTASATDAQEVARASKPANSEPESQPKYESFKPNDRNTDKERHYSGTIHGIRWTSQEGKRKKIRAVIMADDGADPQTYMDGGKLYVLFSSSLENSASLASPFSNVMAELKSSSSGAEMIFTPRGITKAEKYVLDNPRRIAIDFFFPASANIIGTAPATNTTDILLPGQVARTQPQTTAPSRTAKADPEITSKPYVVSIPQTPRRTSPAVNTLPSTITIPTSQQAAEKLGTLRRRGVKTVVVDAGHGGKDPGASANGVTEKNVNLGIALELERVLKARGYNVIMTRNTDVYLKLQERTDIANNAEADLFVSIHVNALPSKKSMTGIEIYIMALPTDKDAMNLAKIENREYVEGKGMNTENVDRKTELLLHILGDMQQNNKISASMNFATMLYNSGVRSGLPMRRVAQAPFFVLRGAGMPAVLVETGFVTNANEAQSLNTQPYQQRIANALCEGIVNYIK